MDTRINNKQELLSSFDIQRILEMAWEDRTPFEAIESQFGLTENEVRTLVKAHLKFGSYKRWRIRMQERKSKHEKKRAEGCVRFKSALQRNITLNRISKRNKRN